MELFDAHPGFWSAILSQISIITCLVTAFMAYMVGKIPYNHKLVADILFYQDKDVWHCGITIVNSGPAEILIREICARQKKCKDASMLFFYTLHGVEVFQTLKKGEVFQKDITVREADWEDFIKEFGIDLNGKIAIEIYEVGKSKPIVISKGFSVG